MTRIQKASEKYKLDAVLRHSQAGEKRGVSPVLPSTNLTGIVFWWGFGDKQLEGLKRFPQHRGILLSVVAEPSFPKREGPNAVIWHGGFAVGDDVFDVLTRTQLDPTSEKLLRSNRSDTCFLVVARLSRDALADDEILDLHISTGQAFFVIGQDHACNFQLLKIRIVVVGFGQDREHFMLHSIQQRRRVVASAFEPSDFDFAIFANCEEAIRDRNILILLRRKEDNVSVDGLNRQRKAGLFLDVSGKLLVVFVRRSFLPHIERVHQGVDQFKSVGSPQFPSLQEAFPARQR